MAKKTFSKKSLKNLFTRSDSNVEESPVKSPEKKTPDGKKKFKLPKLKIKSKGSPSAEKKQQVFSPTEPNYSPVDGHDWVDNTLGKMSSSIYGTAPRSKVQELSYSETDLHKPNKFATFSFGLLKKRKKKKDEKLSSSTFGLNSSDVEKHVDYSEMVDDDGNRKTLSMSQPALDTSDSFDIPSPPSIHSNLLNSYFALSQPRATVTEPQQQHLTNGSDLHLHQRDSPDLQQHDSVPLEEKENLHESVQTPALMPSASSSAETVSQSSQHPFLDASDQLADDVGGNSCVEDQNFLQESNTDAEIPIRQPSVVSHHETNGQFSTGEPNDADRTLQSEPVPSTEVLYCPTEESLPEHAEKSRKSSNQKIDDVNQDVLYGALYESLFPRSFTSEVLSSLPTSHKDEARNLTTSDPLIVETPSYFQKETDASYSSLSASSVPTRNVDTFSYHQSFSSYKTLTTSEDSSSYLPPSSSTFSYSEDLLPSSSSTFSYSEDLDKSPYSGHENTGITFNSHSVYEETHTSISAPPVSDNGTSQRTDTQVTNTKRRAILLKEVSFDENSGHSGVSKTHEVSASLKNNMDVADKEVVSPGKPDAYTSPCSPVYLSVGSDDSSAVDVYFSAEEDNMDSLDEQTYIMDKIEEESFVVTNFEKNAPMKPETNTKSEHFELPSMQIEQTQDRPHPRDDHEELLKSPRDISTDRTEFLKASYGVVEEIQFVTKELPQIKEDLLASPVLQVKAPTVCEFAAPSGSRQGEGIDETRINITETAELHQHKQPFSHDAFYPPDRNVQSQYSLQTNVKPEDEDLSTLEFKETKNILIIPDNIEETSQEQACSDTESAVTENSSVDGTPVEHNRLLRKSEWVDTITESAGVQPEQVPLALTDLKVDAHQPKTGATEELSYKQEHQEHWSSAETSESLNANTPKTNTGKMNSGYSSLSTTISLPDKTDDSRYRFRKVSLVHENDNASKRDVVDFSSNGMEHSWKNTFDSVSRFSSKEEPSILSDSSTYRRSDTSSSSYTSSVFPEATPYSYGSQSELGSQPKAFLADDTDVSGFSGVFKATLVELDDPAPTSFSPPASPDADSNQSEMDNLVDTLKSMGPSLRPRSMGLRGPPPTLVSALPPIVEDASPVTADVSGPAKKMETGATEAHNGIYTLPADLGLKRNTGRDTRSPLELMKKEAPLTRDLPVRASASNSILMRQSSETSDDHKSLNGTVQSPTKTRLDNSVIFGSYRSSSTDQTQENNKFHRPVFRSGSLPDLGFSPGPLKELGEVGGSTTTDSSSSVSLSSSRFERLSFLLNSSSSSSSLSGDDHNTRMSIPPLQNITSSSTGPTRVLSPTSSLDNHRLFPSIESTSYSKFGQTVGQGIGTSTPSSLSTPSLQRSFSQDSFLVGSQHSSLIGSNLLRTPQIQKPEPERNVKYRAFPDAYLTKEKEHGKLNPRPGKMYIFDRPGMCGQRIELRSDVVDATSWELQETISIRVVRGGWVLYEKRNFKGEKVALDEGDIELTCPFKQEEAEEGQQLNGQKVEEKKGEENEGETQAKPARRFIIGSIRRAVRDYSVPEISLFPEENAEGKKVIFRDTSDDARIFGFPIKANSIIISAGLWLVYAKPFFEGSPRVLEVGGYSNPAAWGVEQPYVGSLHPLKVGEPRVENLSEPKIEIYERSYFTGKSRILTGNMRDFMTRVDRQQGAFMYSVGSLKVHGGIWVGYEKEGYRGHQYLLEEGEYHDWRVWGGANSELRSVRVLQADLSEPLMVMFEQPEDEEGSVPQQENTFEVTEAIPDVELFDYKINSRSIQVFSGIWVAYSHVDFSGNQYILEKGFYSNCADWGSRDTRICSVQPVRLAPTDGNRNRKEILLYSEPEYKGKCLIFNYKQNAATEEFQTKSCRVVGGSWVLYENKDFTGTMYVLSEGGYSSLISMGCSTSTFIRSIKAVPMSFSVPSISLFGLEGLEGREITTESELVNMVSEGFNDHVLSVRVNSGCWVLFEFGNYRGRQFLLEPIEITNWPKFSSIQTVGSMYPVRQKRHFFRIRNADSQHLMSVQGGVDEMKSGRVVVSPEVEQMSDIWFYQDGLIKNKLCPTMCLQVMGNVEPAAKLVLWTETRQPSQTWMAQMRGRISSITFPGMVIDVKGGQNYDKEHVVVMPESDERLSQQWEIVLVK
ncbi:uncharacterized protein crybg2 [Corythoichthys intestinalis]|uniref:uncharacterized protein crybg2 n=1 Tax=Corythoichthys intestinalis TaxID=161448 RepID=UPI0025A5F803|nr:uncharacterized protein crybg2 [Corythoichthys intestinalis]